MKRSHISNSPEANRARAQSFEIEEEEFDEALGLLGGEKPANHVDFEEETPQGRKQSIKAWRWWTLTMVLAIFLAHYIIVFTTKRGPSYSKSKNPPLVYTCPRIITGENSTSSLPKNLEQWKEMFPERYPNIMADAKAYPDTESFKAAEKQQEEQPKQDDWNYNYTYQEIKAARKDWKVQYFASPLLKLSQTQKDILVYESASGVGINLYMTMEVVLEELQHQQQQEQPILKDESSSPSSSTGPNIIWVYGNDFIADITEKADQLFERLPLENVQKGHFCVSDSTNLTYIPSNSFDLVFTGRISPLLDPLDFQMESMKETRERYVQLCNSTDDVDWKGNLLRDQAQSRQENWFGLWVDQMVRIAKPGAPILVESVSLPFCDDDTRDGLGGVSLAWWTSDTNMDQWGVDPSSLQFVPDTVGKSRYHVFMLKKKLEGSDGSENDNDEGNR